MKNVMLSGSLIYKLDLLEYLCVTFHSGDQKHDSIIWIDYLEAMNSF